MPHQKELMEKSNYGATMRLGAYAAQIKEGSVVYNLYHALNRLNEKGDLLDIQLGKTDLNKPFVIERHRHRYEVNPKYLEILERNGFILSGWHIRLDDTKLVEFIELPREKHPFFIATQAHPEFKSTFESPSPLFYGFLKACSSKTI